MPDTLILLDKAAAALVLWQPDAAWGGAADSGGVSFLLMLVQTLVALGLVCGLAYVIFRWVLPRLNAVSSGSSMVRVVDRVGLDARKSLYVIEVAGRWLLIAASEAGVQVISELDEKAAAEAAAEIERVRPSFAADAAAVRSAFADRLAQLMNRKGSER